MPLLLLAACATGPTLDQRLSVFVGRVEGDLVQGLGVPVRVHEADGRRFLAFEQRRSVAVAGAYPPFYGPRWGYWAPPPVYAQVECDITAVLRDGRVESFSYRGQGCG